MEASKKSLRVCEKGHKYYKSSDCPVCPICANANKPDDDFLSTLSAPARRALQNIGIATPQQLANYTEAEILALHGMGPSTIPRLHAALKKNNLSFRNGKSKPGGGNK